MQPFLNIHFVGLLAVVVLLPELFHPPPLGIHALDDTVGRAEGQQGDGAEDDAAIDISNLAALK